MFFLDFKVEPPKSTHNFHENLPTPRHVPYMHPQWKKKKKKVTNRKTSEKKSIYKAQQLTSHKVELEREREREAHALSSCGSDCLIKPTMTALKSRSLSLATKNKVTKKARGGGGISF